MNQEPNVKNPENPQKTTSIEETIVIDTKDIIINTTKTLWVREKKTNHILYTLLLYV